MGTVIIGHERHSHVVITWLKIVKMVSMSRQFCGIVLLFLASTVSCYDDDISLYEEDASDPRLLFANYTSGLLAVNTTILAYAGIIVAAGIVVGLVLYFIATNPQSNNKYYSNSYSNSQYYSQARMLNDVASNMGDWNLLGLVTKALEVYKQMNEDE